MNTTYKYIEFIEVEQKPKVWECRNKHYHSVLGVVKWYVPWRQYIYCETVAVGVIYSAGCLRDIADFVEQANEEQKER